MKKISFLITFLFLAISFVNCKGLKDKKNDSMVNLENTNWDLVKVREKSYVSNEFQPEGISISFSDLYFSTSDGCNAVGGDYTTDKNTIEFNKVRKTMRVCDEEVMKYSYVVEFHNAKKFKIEKNKLFLYDADGVTILAEYKKK